MEAKDEKAAFEASDDWEYLGYVDGEDTDSAVVGSPFGSKAEALVDVVSYVEG